MLDANGNENFQGIIKEIKRKDHTIENPFFYMFDILTLEEFTFFKRLCSLRNIPLGT
jgi:hypothetical protein